MNVLLTSLATTRDALSAELDRPGVIVAQRIEFNQEICQINRLIDLINASRRNSIFHDRVTQYVNKMTVSLNRYKDKLGSYIALSNNGHDRSFVYALEDDLKAAA